MSEVGIVYYGGDGAGHAMRMMAVAQQIEDRGLTVEMTGGGPGERFLRINDKSHFSPSNLHFVDKIEEGSYIRALAALPISASKRVNDIRGWIKDTNPEILVVDDPVAVIAAVLEGKKFYFLSHWDWSLPEKYIEKIGTFLIHRFISLKAEGFFVPSIWEGGPPNANIVGPLAPKAEDDVETGNFDVLVVPSSLDDVTEEPFDEAKKLGLKLKKVGSEDWDPKPCLQPYIEEADIIICSGYSTIMESAVAGTPCIMIPSSSEQRGVIERMKQFRGFIEYSGDLKEDIDKLQEPSEYSSGATEIAQIIDSNLKIGQ